MSEKPELITEVKNDYSIINKYADNVLSYHQELLKFKQTLRIRQILFGSAIVIISIGLLIFLYFAGLAILERSKKFVPEQEVIKEIILENQTKDTVSDEGVKIKTEFTIFKTKVINDFSIVTGWRYDPKKPDAPNYEYCYHRIKSSSNEKAIITDLAKKNEKSKIIWATNIDDELRRLAKKYCEFSVN